MNEYVKLTVDKLIIGLFTNAELGMKGNKKELNEILELSRFLLTVGGHRTVIKAIAIISIVLNDTELEKLSLLNLSKQNIDITFIKKYEYLRGSKDSAEFRSTGIRLMLDENLNSYKEKSNAD